MQSVVPVLGSRARIGAVVEQFDHGRFVTVQCRPQQRCHPVGIPVIDRRPGIQQHSCNFRFPHVKSVGGKIHCIMVFPAHVLFFNSRLVEWGDNPWKMILHPKEWKRIPP